MNATAEKPATTERPPQVAEHVVLRRIGKGSYGEVWLARNVLGCYRAVKVISRQDFRSDAPFEREFSGILKYEPVSRAHPGHVDILQVGRDDSAGCFYYVMELADDASGAHPHLLRPASAPDEPAPDWLASYEPRTLKTEMQRQGRLPVAECLELGLALANALHHLHQHGLVHRDIKPANVIFIGGQPELADLGLVTEEGAQRARFGTEGFIAPEGVGTFSGDLYSLGRLLYELSTGLDRKRYPELPRDFAGWPDREAFLRFNAVLTRLCDPRAANRHPTAAALRDDLLALRAGTPVRAPAPRRHVRLAAVVAMALLLAVASFWGLNVATRKPADPGAAAAAATPATLTEAERAAGFRLLFDGVTLNGWREQLIGDGGVPGHWVARNQALVRVPTPDANWSRLVYAGEPLPQDFELRFEWKLAQGSQGGVFYLPGLFKYQLIDGEHSADLKSTSLPGALFTISGPSQDWSRPLGEWNAARILRRGAELEHWLNDQLVVRLNLGDPKVRDAILAQEARMYGQATFGNSLRRRPSLRLLECGQPLALRRIMVRPLPPPETGPASLREQD